MKKLFMLSLAALVFAPVVYAQQPAQSSELAKLLPDDSASDRSLHSDYSGKECLRDVPHPRRTGHESSQRLSTPLPPSHVSDGKVNPNRYECLLCHAEVLPQK